jgi:hypothetical protein
MADDAALHPVARRCDWRPLARLLQRVATSVYTRQGLLEIKHVGCGHSLPQPVTATVVSSQYDIIEPLCVTIAISHSRVV